MATGWKSAAALDDVTVTVTYEDGVDDRSFVLGGFIDGAILEPPIPSVDWADRAGELVTLAFSRRVAPARPASPAPLVAPPTEPDSFAEWLAETTPGGPVMAQMLIVLIVFVGVLLTAPATPWGLIMGAVVLTMTGWVPVLFGFGSTIAASVVAVNVVVRGVHLQGMGRQDRGMTARLDLQPKYAGVCVDCGGRAQPRTNWDVIAPSRTRQQAELPPQLQLVNGPRRARSRLQSRRLARVAEATRARASASLSDVFPAVARSNGRGSGRGESWLRAGPHQGTESAL